MDGAPVSRAGLRRVPPRTQPGAFSPGPGLWPFGRRGLWKGATAGTLDGLRPRIPRQEAARMESTTRPAPSPFPLTAVFFALLAAHRPACRQARTFHRLSAFAVGW